MNNTKKMVFASVFTGLTAIGAFIKIPLPFVPIVLQGLFVLLSGICLGSKWGALSQIAYVTIGLAGVPIFAQGGGIGYVLNPTFGYLIGFILGAYWVGKIIEKAGKHDFKTVLLACIGGTLVIYAVGVPYLAVILKVVVGKTGAVKYALWTGFLVTLPGDIVKGVVATLVAQKMPEFIFDDKGGAR